MDAASYGYPLTNPFEATIATTPPELRPELPHSEDIDQKDYSLKLRPEREFALPDNFWPVKKLRYRLARQDHAAPLIFIIAGTGAHYASSYPEYLKKLFYQATTWCSCPRRPVGTSWPAPRASPHRAFPATTPMTCTG